MARELKAFLVFGGMILGGLAAVFGGLLALPKCGNPSGCTVSPVVIIPILIAIGVGFLSLCFGVILLGTPACCSFSDFRLALRWCFVIKRPFKEFPLSAHEREVLHGWAEKVLEEEATSVSTRFYSRDQAKEALSKLESEMSVYGEVQTPDDLPKTRKIHRGRIADKKRFFGRRSQDADRVWKRFLKSWDLFRNLGMLPRLPTDPPTPWNDPNGFRKYVLLKQGAPCAQTSNPAEQTDAPIPPIN